MEYQDFDLEILPPQGDVFPVRVKSPAGEGHGQFCLSIDAKELVACLTSGAPPHDTIQAYSGDAPPTERTMPTEQVGGHLFDALLSGSIRSLFDTSLGMVHQRPDTGLRIRLRIDPDEAPDLARIAGLPWEYLYQREIREFLSLSIRTPVVRYLEVERPSETLPLQVPLRILVAQASPSDQHLLALDREETLIRQALDRQIQAGNIDITFQKNTTVTKLLRALDDKPYHVLHYMGHGDFDDTSGEGLLCLEDDSGKTDPLLARKLMALLRDRSTVRLVFLNSCRTATMTTEGEHYDAFMGVAPALVLGGMTAVIAMQFPFSDEAGRTFSQELYIQLAKGCPIDEAVSRARLAVHLLTEGAEWGTPVLFMRAPDGKLFEVPRSAAAPSKPAEAELPKPQPSRLFPGLLSFGIEDAAMFFGRERETNELLANIERDPVVVVNGLSGCGKSSLIKAGVIPRLKASGYQVIYTPVFENIVGDVLHEVEHLLNTDQVPENYVDALQKLYQQEQGRHLVLIVDQFEQALGPSHAPGALETFVRGIPHLVRQAHRFATVAILLRADWLYFLETSVRRFYPTLNVYSVIFTLDPLGRGAAREAIVKPLQTQGVAYDEAVIDTIVDCLQRTSDGPSVGPYIQPIQLQMVLRALLDLAAEAGVPQQALTAENYARSGGVESILRNYLTNSLGSRAEAWRLLARFIDRDGKTARTMRRSELLAVPAAEDVAAELEFLIDQGFVEAYEVEGTEDTYYRPAHDYLVDVIVDYLNKNPDQQGWKLAEDWLASGVVEWCESTAAGSGDGLLLEKNRYLHIYQYRDKLKIAEDAQRLLVLTALRYGHSGLGYWLSRGPTWEDDLAVVAEKLLAADPDAQQAARAALAGCATASAQDVMPLAEPQVQSLRGSLGKTLEAPADSAERDAAARGLWAVGAFATTGERLETGAIVFRRWVQDHSLQIASYFLAVFFTLILVLGGLYVHNRLRGSWQPIQTLRAGPVPLIDVDSRNRDASYVVTIGGPRPREGISLFVQRGGAWEMLGQDFSKAWPTSLLIVPNETGSSFYLTLYGDGVIRSRDEGQSWELVNRGLPSHSLTSLVADPTDPKLLYVATDDGMGVLQSLNGGDSWDFYDYRGEIYGARISGLAYTTAQGGALLAGTNDGRILMHRRDASDWALCFGLAKGAINVLVVAEADDSFVYAGTSRGIILRSRDGGSNWEALGQPASDLEVTTLAVAPDDPERLYIGAHGNGGYTVWQSQDAGQHWEMVRGTGLPRVWIASLVLTGQDKQRLVAGTADGLFASTDGGTTWSQENLGAPLATIRRVAVSAGYAAPIYVVVGGSIYVNDGTLYDNPGASTHEWVHGEGLEAEAVRTLAVDPDDPRIAYVGVLLLGEWSVFSTRDGGQTWQRTAPPPIEPIVPDTMALALGKTQDRRTVIYAGTVGCGVFRSEDEGKSWDTLGRSRCDQVADPNMPSDVSLLAVDSIDPYTVYAAAGQRLYYSSDGGASWQHYQPDFASPIMGLATDPSTPNLAYLITGSDGFWRSEDGGGTWQHQKVSSFEGTELTTIAPIPGEAGHLIVAASNGGVWETSNGGQSWRSIREDLALSSIGSIATSRALEGKVLAGSLQDGMALFVPGHLLGKAHETKE
jgi:photosystem II stability/assembly factor-like uncharacterized protein